MRQPPRLLQLQQHMTLKDMLFVHLAPYECCCSANSSGGSCSNLPVQQQLAALPLPLSLLLLPPPLRHEGRSDHPLDRLDCLRVQRAGLHITDTL